MQTIGCLYQVREGFQPEEKMKTMHFFRITQTIRLPIQVRLQEAKP